jgi:hypothetical protein
MVRSILEASEFVQVCGLTDLDRPVANLKLLFLLALQVVT